MGRGGGQALEAGDEVGDAFLPGLAGRRLGADQGEQRVVGLELVQAVGAAGTGFDVPLQALGVRVGRAAEEQPLQFR